MARWKVTISGKGVRKDSIAKLVESMREKFGEGVSIGLVDDTPPESRADRFNNAIGMVNDAKSEIESLKEELESWYENLPEGFQNGDKGEALQSAMSELDECLSNLESAEGCGVEFPGMY